MLLKIIAIGVLGLLGYKLYRHTDRSANAAFAADQPHQDHTDVRDAGPRAMRDPPKREWTETDEELDESFPASDPPGGY